MDLDHKTRGVPTASGGIKRSTVKRERILQGVIENGKPWLVDFGVGHDHKDRVTDVEQQVRD